MPVVSSDPSEMVSVLYNFIRVDIESFLSDTKHVEVIISMCKTVRCASCMYACSVMCACVHVPVCHWTY